MRILIMTPYIGSVYGGIPTVVKELLQALAASRKLSVDLITTNANGSDLLDVPLNCWIEKDGYRVRYFSGWNRNDLIFSPSLILWLWEHSVNYDLLHSHILFSPLNGLVHRLCRWRALPYIMTPHGMLEPWALAYKAWKKKSYYQLVEKNALQGAAAIHALTSTEVRQIQKLGFETPVLIPNGIHRRQFDPLPSSELFYKTFPNLQGKSLILFLGRIDPKKGLDLLAKAYAQIANLYPNSHLVIAGPDTINYLPTAQSYFQIAGCRNQVTFTGMLNGNIKFSALAASQLYVAPSYSEGFSMSILEGMASSLPCIFTKGCNFPEAAKAKAACEVEIDADAIALALLHYLQYPQEAQSMGEAAQQFVFEQYSWDSIAERLGHVYQEIMLQPEN